ncbi:MAG: ABC transporter permease [Chloroflexi bacterium]|nr:ABC transporter permease [Chloroflexota bacterium]MCL5075381.1 ABC transporter permease [Chloroflexota bacterium]
MGKALTRASFWSQLGDRYSLQGIFNASMPLLAVVASFIAGAIVIQLVGVNPIVAYQALLEGAFGNLGQITTSIIRSIPLMLAGLAITLSFRGGVFNIGAEGQLYMAAIFATWVGTNLLGLPAIIHLPLAIIASLLGGLLWGAIPGYLKATRGFNEVIVTILMNYIAIWLASYAVHGPLKEPGWNPQSALVAESARLPIIFPGTRLHAGILLALLCAVFVYIVLWRTTLGYQIRMVGANASAAQYAGINVAKTMVITMGLSGALAGLAGGGELLGVQYRLLDGFSPGYGYDAIAVALLGRLHPFGTLLAALFFGALRTGANAMQTAVQLPVVVVYIIQALAVLFMIAGTAIQFAPRILERKEIARAGDIAEPVLE